MASLKEDRTILFESVADFVAQYESHISKGGFLVESSGQWELRKPTEFKVCVTGTDEGVPITAEVVYCEGGKVGIQFDPESGDARAMGGLARQLKIGPTLQDDGIIVYPSVTAFLADFESNVASGGFYLRTTRDWPLGGNLEFFLRIMGHREDVPVRAAPVFAEGGMVSLQIEYTQENVSRLNDLVKDLRKALKKTPAIVSKAQADAKRKPDAPAETFTGFRGSVVASQDAEEFESATPAAFQEDGRYDTTLFTLVASLSSMRRQVSLLIEKNGDRVVLQFDAEGDIVCYEGPRSETDFLERMAAAGFISAELSDEFRRDRSDDQPAADLVIERNAATERQVAIVFRDQVVDALESVRAMGQARFQVDAKPVSRTGGVRFGKLIIAWMEKALKALEAKDIKKMLKPIWERKPRVSRQPVWVLSQLDIDDRLYQYIQGLSGSVSLKGSLAAIDKKDRDKALRLVLALRALGCLEFLEADPKSDADKPRPAKKKERPEATAVEELAQDLKVLEEGDIFEQAGVHWSAHPDQFDKALQEMERQYGPGSNLYRTSTHAAQLCGQRMQMAKMAIRELKNDVKRKDYIQSLVPHAVRKQSARLLFHKAQKLISEQKYPQAIQHLEVAVEVDPQPEYLTRLEYIRKHGKKA